MLLLIILLTAAPHHFRAEEPPLTCPDLAPALVCPAAEQGFDYNDGCNGVVCSGDGRHASTTLKACRAPETQDERSRCERLARSVWGRLGPFTCPNVDAVIGAVCATRGSGFAFSDGCNRVRCLSGGGHASTRMSCPVTDPEGPYCRFVESAMAPADTSAAAGDSARAGGGGSDDGGEEAARFECPSLHHTRVCSEYLPGFAYHDGCRRVTCVDAGFARMPPGDPDCPEPGPRDADAAAYCAAAERRMQEKKSRSSFYTSCLQPDTVCRASKTAELAFHDGCNRCFCLPDRNAACTKAACPPRFLTPEEFAEHCKRVGAGAIARK